MITQVALQQVCVESLSVSSKDEEKQERRAGKSTYCSIVLNKSKFLVPKIYYVRKFETITIKPN
ncbi:hypothetical protein R6Q57_022827 [Mikania cordata]